MRFINSHFRPSREKQSPRELRSQVSLVHHRRGRHPGTSPSNALQFRLPFDRTGRDLSRLPRDFSLIISAARGGKEDRVSEVLAKVESFLASTWHVIYGSSFFSFHPLSLSYPLCPPSPTRSLWNPFNATATWQGWKTTAARSIFDLLSSVAISHVNWQFFEHARCFLYRRARKKKKHRYEDQTKIRLWSSALLPTSPHFFFDRSRIGVLRWETKRERRRKREEGSLLSSRIYHGLRVNWLSRKKFAIESMSQSLRNNSGFVLKSTKIFGIIVKKKIFYSAFFFFFKYYFYIITFIYYNKFRSHEIFSYIYSLHFHRV